MRSGRDPRYKGARPFEDTDLDRRIFFGRDQEARSLLNLILAEDFVVLFARSGLGKTSLLNARLLPSLRSLNCFPFLVRINHPRGDLPAMVLDQVQHQAAAMNVEFLGGQAAGWWGQLQEAEFWSANHDLLRPVLILDQFEELFTLQTPGRREEFTAGLGSLARAAPVGRASATAGDGPEGPGRAVPPPRLKIVLSLREEYLAELQALAGPIPGILQNRFRLGPLTDVGARNAIVEPAKLDDEGFQTSAFAYTEEAVEQILGFLARTGRLTKGSDQDELEPFQLQIICAYVEDVVRQRQQTGQGSVEVTAADLGGPEKLKQVLLGFYDGILRLPDFKPTRRAIRRLCEESLISPTGRRIAQDEEEIGRRVGLKPDTLRQLAERRLLRSEPRRGGNVYELSHDALVEPILVARDRRWRARRRRVTSTLVGLLLLVTGFALWSFLQPDELSRDGRLALRFQGLALLAPDNGECGNLENFDRWLTSTGKQPSDLAEILEFGLGALSAATADAQADAPELAVNVLRAVQTACPYILKCSEEGSDGCTREQALAYWLLDAFPLQSESPVVRERAKKLRGQLIEALPAKTDGDVVAEGDWVSIEGGTFEMGSEDGDSDERPVHSIDVRPFRLLRHEVTNAEFAKLFKKWESQARSQPQLPAVSLDWYQAYVFAAWLGGRLPTEAEWEYAARSQGKNQRYPWENSENDICERAVVIGCSLGDPLPVGSLPKGDTDQGVSDMAGNVGEWLADWYAPYPTSLRRDQWGPIASPGGYRVIRGGSYDLPAVRARVSDRDWRVPWSGGHDLGFRVVVPVPPQP